MFIDKNYNLKLDNKQRATYSDNHSTHISIMDMLDELMV